MNAQVRVASSPNILPRYNNLKNPGDGGCSSFQSSGQVFHITSFARRMVVVLGESNVRLRRRPDTSKIVKATCPAVGERVSGAEGCAPEPEDLIEAPSD